MHAALVLWNPKINVAAFVLDRDCEGRRFTSPNDVAVYDPGNCYSVEQGFKRHNNGNYAPNGLYMWLPAEVVRLVDGRYDKPNGVTIAAHPDDRRTGRALLVTTDIGRFTFRRRDKDGFDCHDMGALVVDHQKPACIYAYVFEPPAVNAPPTVDPQSISPTICSCIKRRP